ISGIKGEMNTIKTEISGIKGEMNTIKTEISGMKDEMSTMKTEISTMKNDIGTIKTDISELKHKVDAISEQTAILTEFRTETMQRFQLIESSIEVLGKENFSNKVELVEIKKKIAK
ncbi:MAG TPA: hypothetical protein PK033_07180, partial [Acetivibrio sp.]|nr:hypothetical protein [Acetivibrio sp.]HQA57647.1 hypothetical protein [Acetivibrio sp.]